MTFDEVIALAARGCQVPGCDHQSHSDPNDPLYLNSKCHPRAAVQVAAYPEERVLRITCKECKKLVVEVSK